MASTLGANCSTGCHTRDHASWGECVQAKGTRVLWANSANGLDFSAEKRNQQDIKAFRDAKRQGINPPGSSREKVDAAVQISNKTGQAFGAK